VCDARDDAICTAAGLLKIIHQIICSSEIYLSSLKFVSTNFTIEQT